MRNLTVLSIPLLVALASTTPASTQTRAGGAPAQQEQRVTPPEARYWVGATTLGGMTAMGGAMGRGGRPSMADMMKLASGGIPTEGRTVELRLGSTLPPKGTPEAFHTMPAGAQVNKPIYLETPQPGGTQPGTPQGYQQPKGRITFYWGCGEKAGPGQPVVLTFDKLIRGENDPEVQALQGAVSARGVNKPSSGNSKTYGDWPHGDRANKNRDLQASFALPSSLAGPHVIEGTYSPRIEFTLPADKTFMEAVRYTATGAQPSGSIALGWSSVRRATGYSIGVMAPERMGDDSANIVMWSSADRPATFIVMEDLAPAEVNRLIGLKAVLPPTTTTCAIPAEVVKATKDGSMLMFTAFGDEATFIHPARPADPATTWDQEWFSRVSFKSTRMDMINAKGVQDMAAMMGGRGGPGPGPSAAPEPTTSTPPESTQSDEEYCRNLEAERAKRASAGGGGGGLGGRLGRLGRLARGQTQQEEAPDPRCVKR